MSITYGIDPIDKCHVVKNKQGVDIVWKDKYGIQTSSTTNMSTIKALQLMAALALLIENTKATT